jgi:Protein of unknown function (DUF1397)
MNNFKASIDHCLDAEEKKDGDIIVNIIINILNYVCHNDGERITGEAEQVL